MPGHDIVRFHTAEDLASSIAGRLVTSIVNRQSFGGHAHIIVTGGRIGTQVLAALSASPGQSVVDPERLDVWWSDERFLPDGDQQRHASESTELITAAFGLPAERVHSIAGDTGQRPEDSARAYAESLAEAAGGSGQVPDFEVALLSIGSDGHIASLFPEHPALQATASVVAVHAAPIPPPIRISLSLSTLNSAAQVWLVASGSAKARAVRLALDERAGARQVPASGVRGRQQTLVLLDEDAAADLPAGATRPGV